MEADRIKWNKKFTARDDTLGPPESFILQKKDLLKPGTVLDVACGDGRNAIYLASEGYRVTGVDIADMGLKRLGQFAKRQQTTIQTHQIDLEQEDSLSGLGMFDNVILMYYKPDLALWDQIASHMEQSGILLVCSFNVQQHEVHGFSKKYCLAPKELIHLHPQLAVLSYESVEESGKFLDYYVFQN